MQVARSRYIDANKGVINNNIYRGKTMQKLNNITAGLACLALSAGVMAQGVTDDEVVLGTSTALSGPAALWGVAASRAAQIRFDMANEDGGVHGRQIRVVLELSLIHI